LETYRGALVIDLSGLVWYRWVTALLDLEAHPQNSIPYVHTGFSTVLGQLQCKVEDCVKVSRVVLDKVKNFQNAENMLKCYQYSKKHVFQEST